MTAGNQAQRGADGIYRTPSDNRRTGNAPPPGTSYGNNGIIYHNSPALNPNLFTGNTGSSSSSINKKESEQSTAPVFTSNTYNEVTKPQSIQPRTISPIRNDTTGKMIGFQDSYSKQSVSLKTQSVTRFKDGSYQVNTLSNPINEAQITSLERARADNTLALMNPTRTYHLARSDNPIIALTPAAPSAQQFGEQKKNILYNLGRNDLTKDERKQLTTIYNTNKFGYGSGIEFDEPNQDFTKRTNFLPAKQFNAFAQKLEKNKPTPIKNNSYLNEVYDSGVLLTKGTSRVMKGYNLELAEHPIRTSAGNVLLGAEFAASLKLLDLGAEALIANRIRNVIFNKALIYSGKTLNIGVKAAPYVLGGAYVKHEVLKIASLKDSDKQEQEIGRQVADLTYFGVGAGIATKTFDMFSDTKARRLNKVNKIFNENLKGKVIGTEVLNLGDKTYFETYLPSTKLRVSTLESATFEKLTAVKESGQTKEKGSILFNKGKDKFMDYNDIPKNKFIQATGMEDIEFKRITTERPDYINPASEKFNQQEGITKFSERQNNLDKSRLKGKSDYFKTSRSVNEILDAKAFNKMIGEASSPREVKQSKSNAVSTEVNFGRVKDFNGFEVRTEFNYMGKPIKGNALLRQSGKVRFSGFKEPTISEKLLRLVLKEKSGANAKDNGNIFGEKQVKPNSKQLSKLKQFISSEGGGKKIYIYEGIIKPDSIPSMELFGNSFSKVSGGNAIGNYYNNHVFSSNPFSEKKQPKSKVFTTKDVLKDQLRQENKPFKSGGGFRQRQVVADLEMEKSATQKITSGMFGNLKGGQGKTSLRTNIFGSQPIGGKKKFRNPLTEMEQVYYPSNTAFENALSGSNRGKGLSANTDKIFENLEKNRIKSEVGMKPSQDYFKERKIKFGRDLKFETGIKFDVGRQMKFDTRMKQDYFVDSKFDTKLDKALKQDTRQKYDTTFDKIFEDKPFREEPPIKTPNWFGKQSYDGGFGEGRSGKQGSRTRQGYSPDFTATQLDFKVKKGSNLRKLLNMRYSGLEIRPILN